jgi:catechol 2,3-dioxygenase-like lactoylglutathione lyase family enzyme
MADFMHVGVTVTDLEQTIAFYAKWFGFKKIQEMHFPAAFFQDSESLYHLPPEVDCQMAMIESEDQKCVLELFQFSNVEPGEGIQWQKTSIHHLAFKVDNIPEVYDAMLSDGVEFYFAPKFRGDSKTEHWIFLKGPDGITLELWD